LRGTIEEEGVVRKGQDYTHQKIKRSKDGSLLEEKGFRHKAKEIGERGGGGGNE